MDSTRYPCCPHCSEDPVHDVEPDDHTLPCTLCAVSTEVYKLKSEIAQLGEEITRLREEVGRLTVAKVRAEAEAARVGKQVERVRNLAQWWAGNNSWQRAASKAVLRTLDSVGSL